MGKRLSSIWDREPAVFMALVSSGIALVSAFGLQLTGEQVGAITSFTAVVVGFITRSKVTPVDASVYVKR